MSLPAVDLVAGQSLRQSPVHLSSSDGEGWPVFIWDKSLLTMTDWSRFLWFCSERTLVTFQQSQLPSPLRRLLNYSYKHISCDLVRRENNRKPRRWVTSDWPTEKEAKTAEITLKVSLSRISRGSAISPTKGFQLRDWNILNNTSRISQWEVTILLGASAYNWDPSA